MFSSEYIITLRSGKSGVSDSEFKPSKGIAIGPDKNVYLTTGDIDGRQTKAQNIKNGSLPDGSSAILRFTQDGEAVGGGILGDTSPLDKYYAYGIRNSFGIDFDPVTGNIWITDNGPDCCDELNLVRPGFNGGWNKVIRMSQLAERFNSSSNLEQFEWLVSLEITRCGHFCFRSIRRTVHK